MDSLIKIITNNYTYRYRNHNKCCHIFKWGSKKGMKCGKVSKYNDKLCHKHRYRYVTSMEIIYKYIKFLFGADISDIDFEIISDKKVINNEIYVYNREMDSIYDSYGYFIDKNNSETIYEYVDRLSALCNLLQEYYKKDNIYKLFINILYKLREKEYFNDILSYFYSSIMVQHFNHFINEFNHILNNIFQRPIL